MLGIESVSAVYKASAFPTVLSLQPLDYLNLIPPNKPSTSPESLTVGSQLVCELCL